VEFDKLCKQLYGQASASVPVLPPAPVLPPVSLPPPPAAPPQTPSGPQGPWSRSDINMDSFLAGVNFSRALSAPQTMAPQVFAPHGQPLSYLSQAFVPPPPPPAPRLTLEDIISLVRAGQPSYPGPVFPSTASHGYQQYPGYFGPRF
jgi:hypothetical protein